MTEKPIRTIGDYYDSIERRRRAEQAKLEQMIRDGAGRREIERQRERVIDAGNTGD